LAGVEVVNWSSKSVVELEAFLRSRGVDLTGGGQLDRATLVEIVMAVAAEEEEEHERGRGREGGEKGGWVEAP
jgi:hypothetical protein